MLYPLFGSLSDRLGRKPVFLAGVIAMGVVITSVFALINTGNPALFLIALVVVFAVAMAPAAGVTGSVFSLAFDTDVRYGGVSIGYTLSHVLGSASAPTIATALYAATMTSDSIVAYLIAVSVASAVSVSLLPGGWRRPLALSRRRIHACLLVTPPSTTKYVPVMNDAFGDSRNATAWATSSGCPIRPSGAACSKPVRTSSISSAI